MPTKVDDLAGHHFGDLVVTRQAEYRASNGGVMWICLCSCGNSCVRAGNDLKRWKPGKIMSCGCRRNEGGKKNRTHGDTGSPEFVVWCNMLDRCHNKNSKAYPAYGGRGIVVCIRWERFEAFLEDMGRRPTVNHSLDRINNNDGYTPSNCRWATPKDQAQNRRTTRFITYGNRTLCLSDWASELGITKQSLTRRLKLWPRDKAMTKGRTT